MSYENRCKALVIQSDSHRGFKSSSSNAAIRQLKSMSKGSGQHQSERLLRADPLGSDPLAFFSCRRDVCFWASADRRRAQFQRGKSGTLAQTTPEHDHTKRSRII